MEKISDEVKEEIEEMDEAETQFLPLAEPAGRGRSVRIISLI